MPRTNDIRYASRISRKVLKKAIANLALGIGCTLHLISLGHAGVRASCDAEGIDPNKWRDRDLLYSVSDSDWQEFGSFEALRLTNPTRVLFAYVIKANPDAARSGVVVIKSGLKGEDSVYGSEKSNTKTVHLVRNEFAARFPNLCKAKGRNQHFPIQGIRIPSKSYDDFHEFSGLQPPELKALQAFHIEYIGVGGICQETDSTLSIDRNVSNRSQFSFEPYRVRNGQRYAIVNLWPGALAAGSDGIFEQRTEIRRYKTSADGSACITFEIPRARLNYFLRINDLDARMPPFDLRYPELTRER